MLLDVFSNHSEIKKLSGQGASLKIDWKSGTE